MSEKTIPKPVKFLFGGLSGMGATLFCQPLDLVKNRMQLSGEKGQANEFTSSLDAIRKIIRREGLTSLYHGLSAGLLRQATYTTTRLGIYTWLAESLAKPGEQIGFGKKVSIGMFAGMIGSFVGTPTEVSLIRMTSDGRRPITLRRNYRHVFDAISRISKEEGLFTLWRGCLPTVVRAMIVNAAQLATYSQAKMLLLTKTSFMKDDIFSHIVASMISGLATTVVSMPVDITKTRIQNMHIIDGKPEYRNAFDVWRTVVRSEGIFALWKGFTPYYMRLGPQTVLIFVFLEQLNKAYYRNVLGITKQVGGL